MESPVDVVHLHIFILFTCFSIVPKDDSQHLHFSRPLALMTWSIRTQRQFYPYQGSKDFCINNYFMGLGPVRFCLRYFMFVWEISSTDQCIIQVYSGLEIQSKSVSSLPLILICFLFYEDPLTSSCQATSSSGFSAQRGQKSHHLLISHWLFLSQYLPQAFLIYNDIVPFFSVALFPQIMDNKIWCCKHLHSYFSCQVFKVLHKTTRFFSFVLYHLTLHLLFMFFVR